MNARSLILETDANSANTSVVRRGLASTSVIVTLIACMIALVVAGFIFIAYQQSELGALRETTRQMRMARQALMEADNALLNVLARPSETPHLTPYYQALIRTDLHGASDYPAKVMVGAEARTGVAIVASLKATWAEMLAAIDAGDFEKARQIYVASGTQPSLDALVVTYFADLQKIEVDYSALQKSNDIATLAVLALQVLTGIACILAFLFASRISERESRARALAVTSANASRVQVTRLFDMTDMLQSAADHTDANAVLTSAAIELIPGFAGALYVFNNSRDRLTLSTTWDLDEGEELPESITVQRCWALKRGKPHINDPASSKLCCEHHEGAFCSLEIPMIARGEILGLLQVFAKGEDATARLSSVAGVATAVADAMSLALANISLRDKLRSQALRDPLTGLYNRRYMEDTLQRVVRLAEREKHEVSVIMIDLDHFKRLNDQYGHAKGDAVLRDAATAIVGQLRETDIACRYGGEELIVVLPNCGLRQAAVKAERIRISIEGLSEPNGAQVSASFGVAAFPGSAATMKDLVVIADQALYRAKQDGRNRVACAAITAQDDVANQDDVADQAGAEPGSGVGELKNRLEREIARVA